MRRTPPKDRRSPDPCKWCVFAPIFRFLGFHLYLVIRNGISERPEASRPVDPKAYRHWYADLLAHEGQPFWPIPPGGTSFSGLSSS